MKDLQQIEALVQAYFEGLYTGQVEKMRSAFDPRAVVAGEVNGVPYYKTIDEYLAGVASRKSPSEQGEAMNMQLLGVDITSNIATARLHVSMLGFNYYNYFSLIRQQTQWLVIAKTLVNVV
jgi:Putative lumazine-binding